MKKQPITSGFSNETETSNCANARLAAVSKKSDWPKIVEIENIVDGQMYFVGKKPPMGKIIFSAWLKIGKYGMSEKPGIAVKYVGGDAIKNWLQIHTDFFAVEVPEDANTRWRAR